MDSSSSRKDTRPADSDMSPDPPRSSKAPMPTHRPNYMTVGTGSPSASAAALTAMLDSDSGYGSGMIGSGVFEPASSQRWEPDSATQMSDYFHEPDTQGIWSSGESEKFPLAGHIHQLHFNQNRVALGRAIGRTIESLRGLQEMNSTWPAHYPSVQRPEAHAGPHRFEPRPGIVHTQTTTGADMQGPPRRGHMRRAWTTSAEDDIQAESSSAAERKAAQEPPRLITPQIAQEFSILKLDLKLGALPQAELVHSLEKNSIAALLDGKIRQSINHLLALRERIEDTSSKVLVTGDLNAGKSTFCNALLRRKLLPEDQQPCTSIFCEVLDARENSGIEEVHAVHKDVAYDRHDESTYDVYRLADLDEIVVDNDRYMQAKIYVKDVRGVDESLLNNGVIDIALIDAPGLNMDSLKTHAVFAREEEIDVVVFVVSAANHFTLSAKEFIWNAAREKAYIFIVVNGFDMIRDKGRCQRMILDQVANLSPRTFKESAELVHFVSSNAIPVISGSAPSVGGGGFGVDEDPWDNDNGNNDGDDDAGSGEHPEGDDPKGKKKQIERSERNPGIDKSRGPKKQDKGKQREQREQQRHDFERLEQSLRRFVLEKRARSKLAPAKTYLQNVLGDLSSLATVNRDMAQSELDRVSRELSTLEPAYERSRRAQTELSDELERRIDEQATLTYERTRETLTRAIDCIAQAADAGAVHYPGAWRALQYADELRAAMLDQVTAALAACEQTAREQASEGVSGINALGEAYLGPDYGGMAFRSDMMFRRKRDALARQVDAPIELWDFVVDPATLLLQLPGCGSDRGDAATNKATAVGAAGTGMAMTAVGLLGSRLVSGGGVAGFGWFDGALGAARLLLRTRDIRKLILPGIILTAVITTTYMVLSIPAALPRRLSAKVRRALAQLDYTHTNATRLSSEVRKVLRYPADTLRLGLARSVDQLRQQREATVKVRAESDVARKYFANLLRQTADISHSVDIVDLDGPGHSSHPHQSSSSHQAGATVLASPSPSSSHF